MCYTTWWLRCEAFPALTSAHRRTKESLAVLLAQMELQQTEQQQSELLQMEPWQQKRRRMGMCVGVAAR
jgi:hypothetical protein